MEGGGKRSATPLWISAEVGLSGTESQSAVAAALCRRTPNGGTGKMLPYGEFPISARSRLNMRKGLVGHWIDWQIQADDTTQS